MIFLSWEQIDNPVCHNLIQVHENESLKFHKFCDHDLHIGEKMSLNKEALRQTSKIKTEIFSLDCLSFSLEDL